jgi:hypothetical protein
MNTINFLEKKKLTYIIIFIFVVFALIHLYKINKQTNEAFATQNITDNVSVNSSSVYVDIPSLSQVRFDGSGLNTLLNAKANVSDLASKANLNTVTNLEAIINGTDPTSGLINTKADKSALAFKANSSNVDNLTNTVGVLSNTVNGLTTNVTNLMNNPSLPDYTIIEYAGPTTSIPAGWQLCDGTIIKNTDGVEMTTPRVSGGSDPILTPNLMEDYILDPTMANRYHSGSWKLDGIPNNEYLWQQSMLSAGWENRWIVPGGKNVYMRMRLNNRYIVTGAVVSAHQNELQFSVKTIEITGYNYKNNVDIYNDLFLNTNLGYSPNNTDKIDFNNSTNSSTTLNAFSSREDARIKQYKYIKFKNPAICNYITFNPKSNVDNLTNRIDLKIGVIVKPINNYIIKQPKKL